MIAMKSKILSLCFLGLVMSDDEACKVEGSCGAPEEEINLIQTRTEVRVSSQTSAAQKAPMYETLPALDFGQHATYGASPKQPAPVPSHSLPLVFSDSFTTHRNHSGFNGCYFNLITVGDLGGFGAYRDICGGLQDQIKTCRGAIMDGKTGELAQMVSLPWETQGEDPRCFAWGGAPWCLTWTTTVHRYKPHSKLSLTSVGNRTFKLMRLDDGQNIPLDRLVTDPVSGKNWVPVVASDNALYFVCQVSPLLVLKYDGEMNGIGQLSWHAGNLALKQDVVQFRGGTPAAFFESEGLKGYVGLGHVTVANKNHSVYAYTFSEDLKSSRVVKVQMPTELMEAYCAGGVWDPFSVDASRPDVLFSVQYSFEYVHDAQIFKTYRLSLGNKSVVAALLPTATASFEQQSSATEPIDRTALQAEVISAWEMDKARECSQWHSVSLVTTTERVHQGSMAWAFGMEAPPMDTVSPQSDVCIILIPTLLVLCLATSLCLKASWASGLSILVGFSCCSSSMLVINKIAVSLLPFPWVLLACQLLFAAAAAQMCACADQTVNLDPLTFTKIRLFAPAVVSFVALLYFNMELLKSTQVETFIIFRTSTPITIHVIDHYILKKGPALSRFSWLALLATFGSCTAYCFVEMGALGKVSMFWLVCWYAGFVFDHIYVKHIYQSLPMSAVTRVYYTNFLAFVPVAILAIYLELPAVSSSSDTIEYSRVCTAILSSCIVGTFMSYFSVRVRDAFSPTAFAHVGNICKLLTIIISRIFLEVHATLVGSCITTAGIFVGAIYEEEKATSKECEVNHDTPQKTRS
jgi:GDP-mannose transporter